MATRNLNIPPEVLSKLSPAARKEILRKGSRVQRILLEERDKTERAIKRFVKFLENELGPAPRPTDAQIGLIVRFVTHEFSPK